jgi:3-hydroxyacyl-CoA dehydrogenase/enoyl-CoA hydratase/3-hydroxybutyryl-CoA epimerase
MKEKGWLGEKSGRGFYVHEKKASPNAAAEALVRQVMPTPGETLPEAARVADARERLVLLMVNEAARLLDEGRASDADTLDLAVVFGTGWAPHRGGPLRYADERGPADVVRSLDALTARLGPRFAPCDGLRRRAEAGGRFREAL